MQSIMQQWRRTGMTGAGWRFRKASGPICFVGDVHGQTDKLRRLWDKLPGVLGASVFDKLNVVFLGDYVDKGPDSRGTVEWLTGDLPRQHPGQHHHFLCGNHDFALAAFLGLLGEPGADLSATWRAPGEAAAKMADERLYAGPGLEAMHLQGARYAVEGGVFNSAPTFASYGAPFGDRAALLAAMPAAHQDFLRGLDWISEISSEVGEVVSVHAGLEDQPEAEMLRTVAALRAKDAALLALPFIEPLCGRANVERMPSAMVPAAHRAPQRYPDPPLFLVSGHHGFLRMNGRRIVLDMGAGRDDADLAALVLQMKGARETKEVRSAHGALRKQLAGGGKGLDQTIVTSAEEPPSLRGTPTPTTTKGARRGAAAAGAGSAPEASGALAR